MPFTDAHTDAANDALAASFPPGSLLRLYTGVDDPNVGPDPAAELTVGEGGYDAAVLAPFGDSTGGVAMSDTSFGPATAAWSDEATVGGIHHPDTNVLLYWDMLRSAVNVTGATVEPVTAGFDLYPGSDS